MPAFGPYRCAHCGIKFPGGLSSIEEVNAEAKRLYGDTNASDRPDYVTVCDVCFGYCKE